jgi:hypothetical protein
MKSLKTSLIAGSILLFAAQVTVAQEGQFSRAYGVIKEGRGENIDAYTDGLLELVDECAENGWKEQGEAVLKRVWALHQPPRSRRKVAGASGVMAASAGSADAGAVTGGLKKVRKKVLSVDEQSRKDKFAKRYAEAENKLEKAAENEPKKAEVGRLETRRKRATDKFVDAQKKLATKCLKRGYPSIAYEVLLWTLEFDPNNKTLRKKLLRQKPFKDKKGRQRWYSAYEIKKAKKGLTLDPEYGWVNAEQKKALKAGKMLFKGKWLPKEKVEELRTDWANHWVYETEHYKVHTNAPLSDAVEFGREVENLYSFFFRTWVSYYAFGGKKPDANLVFGGGMKLGNKKLVMNYYRSREAYLAACEQDPELNSDPLLKQSAGFYDPATGKAYFYRESYGPNLSTIYHEATHQIFGETSTTFRPPTWMVEGLAVYMEDPVVRGARGAERLLAGAEPPPGVKPSAPRNLASFLKSTANRDVFHGANRSENYKTGGAVVHFFMQYRGGIYRTAFIEFMQKAYKNAEPELPTSTENLYSMLRVSKEKLEEQWQEFNRTPSLFDF